MKVDFGLAGGLGDVAAAVTAAESSGYAGVWSAETSHDPFLPLVLAAEHTERLELGTNIAVALARNPMTLAGTAWDLQAYSGGRFNLGIASQVQAHIEKRFSMPWSSPVARMREFIAALRAIWESWQNGTKLDFQGDFYSHTLMTPFFNPGPIDSGPPAIYLAAVGPHMTRVAGEVSDGLLIHGFTTNRYLREVTLAELSNGLAQAGRQRSDVQLVYPAFVVTGDTEGDLERSAQSVRRQLAFYGSTPAYRTVLDRHGWGDLQPELNTLSKQGRWKDMGALITDEILDAFAVVGRPDEVGPALVERFAGVVDRIILYAPKSGGPERWARVLDSVAAAAR